MADSGPDWGVIGTTAVAVIGAVAAGVAAVKRGVTSNAPAGGTDRTSQTLDSVFKLVENLEQELTRKTAELDRLETRATALLSTIAELRTTIADLERQIREIGRGGP